MAVELKSISPTSYLVRRYCPSQYSRNTYTPSTYARKYSGINTYPSREASGSITIYPRREASTPPVGFDVIRRVRESPRSSMSRDRSSLSSDRAMASREFQTPIDKLMKQARIRMSISQHSFMYSWFKYRKLYIYVRIYVWIRYVFVRIIPYIETIYWCLRSDDNMFIATGFPIASQFKKKMNKIF